MKCLGCISMGDEIFEGEVCSKCFKQAEIYCDYCCMWHCLDCLYNEIRDLERELPEYF
jgi:hypothetical protein